MADPPPPHPLPLPPTTTPAALAPLITASSIRTLPAPTVRALSSSLVLTNPADAVKELVDNALDAGATSVAVDVAANTLDHLTVRDNGRSVPPGADRALLGRRHCTSKLRNSEELKDVGGRSLGFRGEALASLAEVVRGLWVTVSVWRERKAGAPVGTVVRVEGFFERWPRELRRVRNVLQGYALARPGVRLQLRVMDRKGYDWVYAPKPSVGVGGGVERVADVVWKVVGKDAAAQCAYSVRVVNGYTVEAFLPRSDAEGKKIAGHGYFLSIDARPVSAARGTMKLIAKTFREKLKKSNPALEDVKDPFIRMGIGCPPGSYDPNVEPSKDDLLFDDSGAVVTALLNSLRIQLKSVTRALRWKMMTMMR
ncbi:histidine kinase-like ATPase [Macrophomina phaseolina]|uniref:Histidine kinase-like ATPase n=1 Tax=Macrophomina phaseolina TaxID=35725 RepID=A0ABQ8GMM9_9PEZI|nr:histidine kinase-like ATPase [Macrophomina phaseolina]